MKWILALAAAEAAAAGGDGPTQAQLSAAASSKISNMKLNAEAQIRAVTSTWSDTFNARRSAQQSKAQGVAARHNENVEKAKQEIFEEDAILDGTIKPIRAAGMHYQKVHQQFEKSVAAALSKWEKTTTKDGMDWMKANVVKFVQRNNAVSSTEASRGAAMAKIVGLAGKLAKSMDKKVNQVSKKWDKKLSAHEGKFEKLSDKLQDQSADAMATLDIMTNAMSKAEADRDYLLESEDPEQKGLEQAFSDQEEGIEEYEQSMADVSKDAEYDYKDMVLDMRDLFRDHIDNGEIFAEEYEEKVEASVDKFLVFCDALAKQLFLKNANLIKDHGAQTEALFDATAANEKVLFSAEMAVSDMRELWQEQHQKLLDDGQEVLAAKVAALQKTIEEKMADVTSYVDNLREAGHVRLIADMAKVKAENIQNLNKATNWVTGKLDMVLSTLQAIGDKTNAMEEQEEKIKDEVSFVDSHIKVITSTPKLIDAQSAALRNGELMQEEKMKELRVRSESTFSTHAAAAVEELLASYDALGVQTSEKVKELDGHIQETAGAAAQGLRDLADSNLATISAFKKETALMGAYLEAHDELMDKTLVALKTLPPAMKELAANSAGELLDIRFAAQQLPPQLDRPIEAQLNGAVASVEHKLDGSLENTKTLIEKSGGRIKEKLTDIQDLFGQVSGEISEKSKRWEKHYQQFDSDLRGTTADINHVAAENEAWEQGVQSNLRTHAADLQSSYGAALQGQNKTEELAQQESDKVLGEFNKVLVAGQNDYGTRIGAAASGLQAALLEAKQTVSKTIKTDNERFDGQYRTMATGLHALMAQRDALLQAQKDESGGVAIKETEQTLAIAQQAQEQMAEMIKHIDSELHDTAASAASKLGDAANMSDEGLLALRDSLVSSMAALEDANGEMKSAVRAQIVKAKAETLEQGQSNLNSLSQIDHAIIGEERQVHETSAALSKQLTNSEGDVATKAAAHQLRILDEERDIESERHLELQKERQVVQDNERASAEVDGEVTVAEAQMAKLTNKRFNHDAEEAEVSAESARLGDEFQKQNDRSAKLAHDGNKVSTDVSREAEQSRARDMRQLVEYLPLIGKLGERSEDYFQDLEDEISVETRAIEKLITELVDLGGDIHLKMGARGARVEAQFHEVKEDIDDIAEMEKFQGADAVKILKYDVGEAIKAQAAITDRIFKKVVPHTRDVQTRSNQVFEDLGMAIDMDAVEEKANATMKEEMELRAKLDHGREDIERILIETRKHQHKALTALYDKTRALIAGVSNMEHLSADEKALRIAKIKRDAAGSTAAIMSKGRTLIQMQVKAMSKTSENQNEVDLLASRATRISNAEFQFTDAATLSKEANQIKDNMAKLRDSFADPFSLLDITEQAKDGAAAACDSTRMQCEATGQVVNIGHVLSSMEQSRDSESADMEQLLHSLGAVLPP